MSNWDGIERRKLNLINLNKLDSLDNKVNDMHGDVKVLVSEIKRINGSVLNNTRNIEKHCDESNVYRHKIDILWATVHSFKWAIGLIFAAGMLWKIIEFIAK